MKRTVRLNEGDLKAMLRMVVNEVYLTRQEKPVYSDKDKLELVKDPNVVDGGNFPIRRNGRVYWVSRSNTVSLYVYCRDKAGGWCVLASKRGPNASQSGKWNVVCGFLDYGYSLEETAIKECQEETGVSINPGSLHLIGTNSNRKHDAVNSCFYAVLDGTIDNYPTDISGCEPGEVSEARWIRFDELDGYRFSGRQKEHVLSIFNEYCGKGNSYNKAMLLRYLKQMAAEHEINDNQYNNILNILKHG